MDMYASCIFFNFLVDINFSDLGMPKSIFVSEWRPMWIRIYQQLFEYE